MTQQSADPRFSRTDRRTAVIGAGTLGSRIALMLASSGGEVRRRPQNSCACGKRPHDGASS